MFAVRASSHLLLGLLGITVLLSFFTLSCARKTMNPEEARQVLNDFYADDVPEAFLDRHLVSAGRAIVPYIIVEIKNRSMPRRRYAIGALEKIGDRRALPVLITILNDSTELMYFREDALRAIWHIDRELGEEYAREYSGRNTEMDRAIELLRKGVM